MPYQFTDSDLTNTGPFNPVDIIRAHVERHPTLTRLLIGLVAVTAFQSGNVVDKALDAVRPVNIAGVVQEAALSTDLKATQIRDQMGVGTDSVVGVDDFRKAADAGLLDGITVEGIPVSNYQNPEAIDVFINGSEELQMATVTVTSLMERVDSGEYSSIIDESRMFEERANFLDDARMQQTEDAINNATSNDEIAAILQEHMQFYDMDFKLSTESNNYWLGSFNSNTNLSNTRRIALDIAQTFKILPKELTDLAGIKTILLGDKRESTLALAETDGSNMYISTPSGAMDVFLGINDVVDGTDMNMPGLILRQISYGLDMNGGFLPNNSVPIVVATSDDQSSSASRYVATRHFADPILGRAAPSSEGLKNIFANIADSGRGVMSSTNDGFVKPSEWRNFYIGESNISVLSFLVQLEVAQQGSAAYFVAHNANLVPPHLLESPLLNIGDSTVS